MVYSYLITIVSIACASTAGPISEYPPSSVFDIKAKPSNPNIDDNSGSKRVPPPRAPFTKDEIKKYNEEKSSRMRERRENARQKIREMIENPHLHAPSGNDSSTTTEYITPQEVQRMRDEAVKEDPTLSRSNNQWLRRTWGWGSETTTTEESYADSSQYYDAWAQAYRMLGAYISCEIDEYNEYNYDYGGNNCVRWVVWAAYLNPNYQGYGRSEYFAYGEGDDFVGSYYDDDLNFGGCYRTDDGGYHCNDYGNNNGYQNYDDYNYAEYATSNLDCHDSTSEWQLLGVYRQDFYEFFEQVVKHVWYYEDYEYIVGSAVLEYLGENGCNQISYDPYGNSIYAALRPMAGGNFSMALYTDWQCLTLADEEELGYNYDTIQNDGGYYDYYNNYNNYGGNDDYYYYKNYDKLAQEYTLTLFNEVFEEFKYCTLCIDYPSYQDGYFNGDYYGTDEDNLINQCWKFYSHDTYICDNACVAMADSQETIIGVKVGEKYYGSAWVGQNSGEIFDQYTHEYTNGFVSESKREHVKANLFFLINLCLFLFCMYVTKENGGFSHMIEAFNIRNNSMDNKTNVKKNNPPKVSEKGSKNKRGWFRHERQKGIFIKKKKASTSANVSGLSFPEMLKERSKIASVIPTSLTKKFSKTSSKIPINDTNINVDTTRKKTVGLVAEPTSTSTPTPTPTPTYTFKNPFSIPTTGFNLIPTRPRSASSKTSKTSQPTKSLNEIGKSKPRAAIKILPDKNKSDVSKEKVVTESKDYKTGLVERESANSSSTTKNGSAKQKKIKAGTPHSKSGTPKKVGLGAYSMGKAKNMILEKKVKHNEKKKEDVKKKIIDDIKENDPFKKLAVVQIFKRDENQEDEEAQDIAELDQIKGGVKKRAQKKTWRDMLKWKSIKHQNKERENASLLSGLRGEDKDKEVMMKYDAYQEKHDEHMDYLKTENLANQEYHLMKDGTQHKDNTHLNYSEGYGHGSNYENYQVANQEEINYEYYPGNNDPNNNNDNSLDDIETDEHDKLYAQYIAEVNAPKRRGRSDDDNNYEYNPDDYKIEKGPQVDIDDEDQLTGHNGYSYNESYPNENVENYDNEYPPTGDDNNNTGEEYSTYENVNPLKANMQVLSGNDDIISENQSRGESNDDISEGQYATSQSTYTQSGSDSGSVTTADSSEGDDEYELGNSEDSTDESHASCALEPSGSRRQSLSPTKGKGGGKPNNLGVIWENGSKCLDD